MDRAKLPFRSVNRRDTADFQPGMQRHHLLPRQLASLPAFREMLRDVGLRCIGFYDFRANGMLLPATENAVMRTHLPLHRGPHRLYNDMVADRFGQLEAHWQALRGAAPACARREAAWRIALLQGALRRRLLQRGRHAVLLNRRDPFRGDVDFTELDAMVERLWASTAIAGD